MRQHGHAAGMARPDRCNLDDLSLDQLDSVVLAQDSGLGHAVVLVDGEGPSPDAGGHGIRGYRLVPDLLLASSPWTKDAGWVPARRCSSIPARYFPRSFQDAGPILRPQTLTHTGKTALLQRFVVDKPVVFHTGADRGEVDELRLLR